MSAWHGNSNFLTSKFSVVLTANLPVNHPNWKWVFRWQKMFFGVWDQTNRAANLDD